MRKQTFYQKTRLNNGSTLGVIKIPGAFPVTISAYIKAGFRHDPSNRPGLAHFTEHMLFNGTKNYPSSALLSQSINQHGGWHDAFTWIEYQRHMIHLPKLQLKKGIEILFETLVNPIINNEGLEQEKGVVKEEILKRRENPETAIWDFAWNPLFFKGTCLSHPCTGIEKDVKNISTRDVGNFISDHFLADSTVFIVAGDVDFESSVKLFDEYSTIYNRKSFLHSQNEVSNSGERVKVNFIDSDQTAIMFGVKTIPYAHQDRHVLDFITDCLGGYFGARLPQRLRDEGGLIYNWNMWQDNLDETGYLFFSASASKENQYKITSLVMEEFEKLSNKKLSDSDMKLAKGHITGSLISNMETVTDFARWYGFQESMRGKSISPNEQENMYKKISSQEVFEVASKYFQKNNFYIAAIGPTDAEKLGKSLEEK
ncbi:MAG: Processing peptidase [Microgenomates group bacterium GW2011_GWA2_39_19]|nr:MAG: Processing peptidase [Microgenomates group bacterium GW2011_GWA2_39_19]